MSKGKGGAFPSLGRARVLEIFPFPLKKKKKPASSTQDVITNSPQVRESNSLRFCLDSRYWFLVIIISGIPDSLSCTPDSKEQVSKFHRQIFPVFQTNRQNFPRFRHPDSLTCGETNAILLNCTNNGKSLSVYESVPSRLSFPS